MTTEFKYDNYDDDFENNPSTYSQPQSPDNHHKTEPENITLLSGNKRETDKAPPSKVETSTGTGTYLSYKAVRTSLLISI